MYKLVKLFTFHGDPCHKRTKLEQQVTVNLASNADSTDKLPPFVIGKHRSPHCFKKVKKKLLQNYDAITNSQIISRIYQDYLTPLEENEHLKYKNSDFHSSVYCSVEEHNFTQ